MARNLEKPGNYLRNTESRRSNYATLTWIGYGVGSPALGGATPDSPDSPTIIYDAPPSPTGGTGGSKTGTSTTVDAEGGIIATGGTSKPSGGG